MLVTPLVLIQIFSKRMLVDWPKCGSDPRDEGHLACLYNFKSNEDRDDSSNDNDMTTKNGRNCSEGGESAFSLSTNDFSNGD